MSALPKAVQDQIDRGNEIADLVYPKDEHGNPIPPDKAENPEDPPKGEGKPKDPPKKEDPPKDEGKPKDPPKKEGPPAAEPPPDPDHKYKVLQGKYNAEVPRLTAQLKDSNELVAELRQRLNNLESLIATMKATPAPEETPSTPSGPAGITDEERAQFGPDLIDVIERAAAAKIMPQVEQSIAPVKQTVEQVSQTASQQQESMAVSAREKTLASLEAAVPNWVEQNEDPAFLQWLNEHDAYAGVPRGQLLTQAFQANDANRVIAFFKGFQTENAVVTPSEPAPPKTEPQVKLEEQVAPGTPKPGTISAPDESGKRQWSRNDISAFYAQKNEYVKKGQPVPDELQKLERDLIAAQAEGRIR